MKSNQLFLSWTAMTLGILILRPVSAWGDVAPPPLPSKVYFEQIKAKGLRISPQVPPYSRGVGSVGAYGVCTVGNWGYSWVSVAKPVTYAMEVTDWQTASAQLLLLPATEATHAPNTASNSLALTLSWLTNGAASGRVILTANGSTTEVSAVTVPSAVGSWSLTADREKFVLRGPAGAEATGTIDAKLLPGFADPLFVYFFTPSQSWGRPWREGITDPTIADTPPDLTIGRIQVTSVAAPIDEQFTSAELDPFRWQIPFPATASRSMIVIPKNAQLWLRWPCDDYHVGPHVQISATLAPGSWQEIPCTKNALNTLTYSYLPLTLPASGQYFYRVGWDRVDDDWW
jgi:hypothetical protein